jgi:hypothetical protein
MKRHTNARTGLILIVTVGALLGVQARSGEIGHYAPGVANIRDYTVPEPGFYAAMYDYWYWTGQLNDRNGNKVNSITINPRGGPGVTLAVDVDVDLYALSPMFIWVSDWKIFGAKYAAYVAPSFSTSSIGASLATASNRGINRNIDSEFGVGDLFVQPLWLGWGQKHWDFALGYGFYAPTGRYNTQTIVLPVVGPITVDSVDNIGLGFWEHQIQGAVSWYPWEDKRMAVSGVLTYGIPRNKEGFDLTPGQNLTLNWGISQYLPLTKDQKLLLEVGPAGYSSWQITDDSGSDARNPSVHDQVHAVGGQLGLTYVPWELSVNFHGFYEFSATDRFQGQSFGINIAKKL